MDIILRVTHGLPRVLLLLATTAYATSEWYCLLLLRFPQLLRVFIRMVLPMRSFCLCCHTLPTLLPLTMDAGRLYLLDICSY